MKNICFAFLLLFGYQTYAQVGINILQPDSNAILDLNSDEKALLLPRLTTAQMNAMQNPTNGLTIYNVEDSLVHYYNDECWLKAYQKNCNECDFIASLSASSGVIDHLPSDSVSFDVNIVQTNGTSDIAISYIFFPPPGMTIDVTNSVIDSVGSATFTIGANIFTQPGTYPIVILATCDQASFFLTYILELPPCIEVDIAASTNNVDLQTDYALPGVGTPVCVIAEVFSGVDVTSTTTTDYAMTWGALDPQSHVGFINNGAVLARGGDGSSLGSLLGLSFAAPGDPGGDALELTTKTTFALNGPIYAGGGGGGSVGTALDVSTSLPLGLGNLGICLAAGSGGGGGSADGLGGGLGGACTGSGPLYFVFNYTEDGLDATSGEFSIPGNGGLINQSFPISIPVTVINIDIVPNVNVSGGDGGDFALPGGAGAGSVGVTVGVSFSIPFVPSINIPIGPFTLISSVGGAPGIAIKTNSNQTVDLATPNNFIKGNVQP